MLSWRLLLRTGDTKYADLIERTLLNGVIVAARKDGRAFFYTNTLHQRTAPADELVEDDRPSPRAEAGLRAPWFDVSCCPTNLARLLASVSGYFATATADGIQIHQYGDFTVDTVVAAGPVTVEVRTGYPESSDVTISFPDGAPSDFTLTARIPSWARDGAQLIEEGDTVTDLRGSIAQLAGPKRPGETVVLSLPMVPRIVKPDARIDALRGQVAIERGPFVLAIEDHDLPDGVTVNDLEIDLRAGLRFDEWAVTAEVWARPAVQPAAAWPYGGQEDGQAELTGPHAVQVRPYYRWGNHGPGTMRVFTPSKE
jgi:DUF1680 family protein